MVTGLKHKTSYHSCFVVIQVIKHTLEFAFKSVPSPSLQISHECHLFNRINQFQHTST